MHLIAVKPMKYGTRRLLPGEPFEAQDRHGRVLVAVRKARYAPVAPEPTPEPAADTGADALKVARADYEAVVGRKPFHGWSVEVLRAKIAEARSADDV